MSLDLASPSERAALDTLDGSGSDAEWAAVETLRREAGDRVPSLLLAKYRSGCEAGVRTSCVFHATRYARTNEDAVQLGREALRDRSKVTRYRACLLLAYSLRRDTLEDLRAAQAEAPKESQEDIRAAIDAIENGNSNFFVDRDHSGKVVLTVS